MDVRNLFLDQHAIMHSAAVGGNKMSAAERAFAGLSDEQMRVRPREDLNSLAWLMWHIARAEDIMVNTVLTGRPQVCDAAWMKRLGIARPDFGIGNRCVVGKKYGAGNSFTKNAEPNNKFFRFSTQYFEFYRFRLNQISSSGWRKNFYIIYSRLNAIFK